MPKTVVSVVDAQGDLAAVAGGFQRTVETSGRTVPENPAVDKQRARFGLPPLSKVPMDEIRALLGEEAPASLVQRLEELRSKDGDPTDLDVVLWIPHEMAHRRGPPDHLLCGVVDQIGSVTQQLLN